MWAHKKKYVARFVFEEFVGIGVMRDLTHAKAGRCFNSRFRNISVKGFEDRNLIEDGSYARLEAREKVKSDLALVVAKTNSTLHTKRI
jgi:hypothetical protein